MPYIGGPKPKVRQLLAMVTCSLLLYAAPIWASALAIKKERAKFAAGYRLSALRSISGFKTFSDEAAYVIAGMKPIDILADEMRKYSRISTEGETAGITDMKQEERRSSWCENWRINLSIGEYCVFFYTPAPRSSAGRVVEE